MPVVICKTLHRSCQNLLLALCIGVVIKNTGGAEDYRHIITR